MSGRTPALLRPDAILELVAAPPACDAEGITICGGPYWVGASSLPGRTGGGYGLTPKLLRASLAGSSPWSEALRYQAIASTRSAGTPQPL